MSDRPITHMVPMDGTEHTVVECYCHPDIHESNGTAALMGLEDAGVQASPTGALCFMHHPAARATRWQEWQEIDEGSE